MKIEPRHAHILWPRRLIERRQADTTPVREIGSNPARVVGDEQIAQSFVPEAPDHA
jgi:hypothetical protein